MSNFKFSTRARREDIEHGHMTVQTMLEELKDHVITPSGPELPGANGSVWTTVAGVPVWQAPVYPSWQSWTPVITGSGGNPTLGSGHSETGRYVEIGKTVIGWAHVFVGGAGFANGTGDVQISLPVTALSAFGTVFGSGYFYDSSANARYVLVSWQATTTVSKFIYGVATTTSLTFAAPVTWGQSDEVQVVFTFEAA